MRSVLYRLEKLEARPPAGGRPDHVLAVVPLPDDGADYQDLIQQWLDDGMAHAAGGVILYTGGEPYPLSIEEWEAQHCNEKGCHPKVTPVH